MNRPSGDPPSARPVLHLLADWKWTGPAEAVVDLVRRLCEGGQTSELAVTPAPAGQPAPLREKARALGVIPDEQFRLRKGLRLFDHAADVKALRGYFAGHGVRIVHTHSGHDHAVGGLAARGASLPDVKPLVVRTCHTGLPMGRSPAARILLTRFTDGLLHFSASAAEADRRAKILDPRRIRVIDPAVDLNRFDPACPPRPVRRSLGIPAGAVVGGIVARVQKRRRFDVLLRALRHAFRHTPELWFVVIGRGTHRGTLAEEPARRMGLLPRVVFAGFRSEDYVDVLAALDFTVFLVPGSDGTCRAVREAMALGKPVVASSQGMLPELVQSGVTGFVVDLNAPALAEAMTTLTRNAALRRSLGARARTEAERRFDPARQTAQVRAAYESFLKLGPAR